MYKIQNIGQIDSPALVVYPDRIMANIRKAMDMAGSVNKLRPHVKTNKMREVCQMMMCSGISKFKCATIAEAEMLGMVDALDVLLAYQPVGPKVDRFLRVVNMYQKTHYSCLIDNPDNARAIDEQCREKHISLDVYIDLNIGMNRTGIKPDKAVSLIKELRVLENLRIVGLHGYDGHIHDEDPALRQQAADLSFALVEEVFHEIQPLFPYPLAMVMGGTPTFPMHIRRPDCECSPGTFIFWDWGYEQMLADMPFEYAALLVSRIVSIVDERHICIDLGHKSVAAESPLPRVCFLNCPEAKPVVQSEEHLVLEVPDSSQCEIGDVLYGVPVHICPTVALYEKAFVVENGEATSTWKVIARDRYINV